MKIARVIPLYKAGDKNVYRQVSILPQFLKILEKVFTNRLNNFLEKNNVITESRYGFHRNRSTSMALIELIEKRTISLDDKKITVGVFIDLKKAFDTINHKLLKKLYFNGVRGLVFNKSSTVCTIRKCKF